LKSAFKGSRQIQVAKDLEQLESLRLIYFRAHLISERLQLYTYNTVAQGLGRADHILERKAALADATDHRKHMQRIQNRIDALQSQLA
jgi:hypothetical protein